MKDRIYIKDWQELKPYKSHVQTDNYYLKLCNVVKGKLVKNHFNILSNYLDNKSVNLLSCFITSYFEDVISKTNIWGSFVELHQELYNKKLPFYDISEYYEDEINEQDVRFLLWYFFNTIQNEKFINSNAYFFEEIAADIMEVLDEAYEYAPENEALKKFYEIGQIPIEDEYYIARNLIDTILFKTYLFYPDTLLDLREDEIELIERYKDEDEDSLISYLNENRDNITHKSYTRLLSLKGKEWAAKIIGKEHPLYAGFLNMSEKISGFFLYKGQDKDDVFIEHVASGKTFNLTKKSFDKFKDLQRIDTLMFMGIVQWKEEWWFSGIYVQLPYNPEIISDEKNSIESKMTVSFLDHHTEKLNQLIKSQFDAFKAFNKGSQIAFISDDKIEEFVKAYSEYYNQSLKLSKKQREKAMERARKEGFIVDNDEPPNYSEISESGLVFFNPKSGVEIAYNANSAFPLPENKFFNSKDSKEHILRLFLNEEISTELAKHCINSGKNKLPFFKSKDGKEFLKDIDFLLRFWKKNYYHTVPAVTMTGTEEE